MIIKLGYEIEQTYRANKSMNLSLLKKIVNPKEFKEILDNGFPDSSNRALRLGSAVDCLLTNPEGEFDKQFKVIDSYIPSGKMKIFIDNLPDNITEESDIEEFKIAYEAADYSNSIETVVSNFFKNPKLVHYYANKSLSEGFIYLTKIEYYEVLGAIKKLKSNPFTNKYFKDDNDLILLYQFPVYFQVKMKDGKEIPCKGLLDLLIIDLENKQIIPVDLKTTSKSVLSFRDNYLNLGYYMQAGLYTEAIRMFFKPDNWKWVVDNIYVNTKHFTDLNTDENNQIKLSDYIGWKVLPMEFVVVELGNKHGNSPRIFSTEENDITVAWHGGETKEGKQVKGIYQLLDDYLWHHIHNMWEIPREQFSAQGKEKLSVFK